MGNPSAIRLSRETVPPGSTAESATPGRFAVHQRPVHAIYRVRRDRPI